MTTTTLLEKEIGNRIALLRKSRGYSQEELAKQLGLNRTAVTQIEKGKRKLSIIEIRNLAEIFLISMDRLMAEKFELDKIPSEDTAELESISERISISELHVPKFKNILLYILERCAGKSNVGETVLYKLLYFSDFNYYELYEDHLSGATYKKLPFGPVPQKLDSVLNSMIKEKKLKRLKVDYHGFKQTRYIPLDKPDLSVLNANEKSVLDKVIDQFSDWSATAIREYSHKDMPWLASEEGDIIDYELVFYREKPFSVRNYD
jgi:transcriptional regulator with XRE-family HTH domain